MSGCVTDRDTIQFPCSLKIPTSGSSGPTRSIDMSYKLRAIVRHIGREAFAGHYICGTCHIVLNTTTIPLVIVNSLYFFVLCCRCVEWFYQCEWSGRECMEAIWWCSRHCDGWGIYLLTANPQCKSHTMNYISSFMWQEEVLRDRSTPYMFFYNRC